jgi:thiol-disulfide isomerase/thioredoxin
MTSAFAHLGTIRTAEAGPAAPREFSAIGRAGDWINSPPLTPERLAGKVVLVNFWTYTCINWPRALPYVRAWAHKYQQQLVVVGVHTPEFAFERNIDNVRRAVRQMNIEYPVAIDNDYAIWRAFDNHYWPARLYAAPARLALNQWALVGDWTMGKQAAVVTSPNGRIVYRFHARDVHLVMGPPRQGASMRFRVAIDGQPPGSGHGADVDDGGRGAVVEQRLYQLIRQRMPIVDRQFEIEFLDVGVETFAFTFG